MACTTPLTPIPQEGWSKILKDEKAPEDGYFVTNAGGRKSAEQKAQNGKLMVLVKENPSFTERLTKNWAVFSAGGVVGVITAVWLGF